MQNKKCKLFTWVGKSISQYRRDSLKYFEIGLLPHEAKFADDRRCVNPRLGSRCIWDIHEVLRVLRGISRSRFYGTLIECRVPGNLGSARACKLSRTGFSYSTSRQSKAIEHVVRSKFLCILSWTRQAPWSPLLSPREDNVRCCERWNDRKKKKIIAKLADLATWGWEETFLHRPHRFFGSARDAIIPATPGSRRRFFFSRFLSTRTDSDIHYYSPWNLRCIFYHKKSSLYSIYCGVRATRVDDGIFVYTW